MKLTHIILIITLFFLASCKTLSAAPTILPATPPTETTVATATFALTKTPLPTSTASDIFGAIPLNSVQTYSIEPVAAAVFEQALQGYVAAGRIQEFRVDRVAVFPSGDGGLIAEIYYSLRTDTDPWVDDFGTPGTDGWIIGKCSRFDLVATETEHQLKNKRLCS